jgi:Integrase zinc binding domain
MHQVVIGVPQHDISSQNQERCEAAAEHLRWDGENLFIKGKDGMERRVVPWCDRRKLVRKLASQMGFPGGKRLYPLARERYYWTSMQRDIITWCTEGAPN